MPSSVFSIPRIPSVKKPEAQWADSIHPTYKREYEVVRGQVEVTRHRMNIVLCY